MNLVEVLARRDVGLRSLAGHIDTTSATGRLVLHVFGALAKFERALLHERTWPASLRHGPAAAGEGRPRALTAAQLAHAEAMAAVGTPVREIAEILGAGRSTLYRAL